MAGDSRVGTFTACLRGLQVPPACLLPQSLPGWRMILVMLILSSWTVACNLRVAEMSYLRLRQPPCLWRPWSKRKMMSPAPPRHPPAHQDRSSCIKQRSPNRANLLGRRGLREGPGFMQEELV